MDDVVHLLLHSKFSIKGIQISMNDFSEYVELQADEMQRHKWIESEKAGYDLGKDAFFDWVDKFANDFAQAHRYEELEWSAKKENDR